MQPETVPKKLESQINHKILLFILVLVIAFQTYVSLIPEEEREMPITLVSIAFPAVSGAAAFYVANKYRGSGVFGKSYLALGLGLVMNSLGETVWLFYYFQGLDPYPSIADIFYLSFYPLALFHLVKNIRFFKPTLDIFTKIMIIIIPVSIVSVYTYLSIQEIGGVNFDLYYGMIYVISSSTTLSAAILGAKIFRQGLLGKAWLLLVIGMACITFGDVWYFYLEAYSQYHLAHPVDLFWYAGYMVITYALIKHEKII
jgi:hypothetical protein